MQESRNLSMRNMLLAPRICFFGSHPHWYFFSQSQSIHHSGAALFVRPLGKISWHPAMHHLAANTAERKKSERTREAVCSTQLRDVYE